MIQKLFADSLSAIWDSENITIHMDSANKE